MLPIASWPEWRDKISPVRGYSNLICLPVTIFCPVPIPDLGWVPFTCSHSLTSSPPSSSSAWSLPGTQHIREAQFSSCSQTCAVHEIKSWSHNQSWRRKVFETWGIFFLSWVMFVIITWAALLGYLPHKHKVSTSSAFRVTMTTRPSRGEQEWASISGHAVNVPWLWAEVFTGVKLGTILSHFSTDGVLPLVKPDQTLTLAENNC